MLIQKLPYNPVIDTMKWDTNRSELTLVYKNKVQRTYNADITVAYSLFYTKNSKECLHIFNTLIKNKLRVVKVLTNGR